MKRADCLSTAEALVNGPRAAEYGPPEINFQRIATMWSAYLGSDVSMADVAAMLVLLKVARCRQSSDKADTWIDIAGYAACGAEVSQAK